MKSLLLISTSYPISLERIERGLIMLNYKNLIIALVLCIAILCGVVLVTSVLGKGNDSSSSSQASSADSSRKVEFQYDTEKLPEGYVAVLGYNDIYKVIKDGTIKGYKIRLSNGEFDDYDIQMPKNFEVYNADKQIYRAVDSNNKVLYYRHFNGKEWDVVDKQGDVLLAIPDNYTRADDSQELYSYEDGKDVKYKKLTTFADGSYAWNSVEPVNTDTTTTTSTTTTTKQTSTKKTTAKTTKK